MAQIPKQIRENKGEIASIVVGVGVSLIFGLPLQTPPGLPKWWIPAFLTLAAAFLSWAIAALYRIAYRHNTEKEILTKHDQELQETRNLIVSSLSHIAVISKRETHPIVFSILSTYANQNVEHITGGHEWVTLEEYLELLKLSLERVTTRMFATSMLSPAAFRDNHAVMGYLRKQKSRKKRTVPGLRMERVFIGERKVFDNDAKATSDIIGEHKDAGVRIGFCLTDHIADRKERLFKDFVFFESGDAKWVIDAGIIAGDASEHDAAKVQLYDNIGYINNNWTTTREGICDETHWDTWPPRGRKEIGP